MASLMEQYERSAQLTSSGNSQHTSSAKVPAKMVPIFSKQKVNFAPTSPITHLVVANNQLVIAMASKTLLRIDLLNPDTHQEVDLIRETSGSRLHQLFLDPTGTHLLISTVPREGDLASAALLYICGKSTKPKQVGQMRGQLITAVGWGHGLSTSPTTGPILLGSSQGIVTELELSADERLFSRLEVYTKQVFEVGEQRPSAAITGLEYFRVAGSHRFYSLLATPSRLYQFVGAVAGLEERPLLTSVFTAGELPASFLDIPSTLSYSRLAFFAPKFGDPPDRLAWMTEPGTLYGELDLNAGAGESILGDTRLIAHAADPPPPGVGPAGGRQPPRAAALTQFHLLTLQPGRLRATCVLDQRTVFEDIANETHGPLVTICRDPVRGTLWSAAERAVFKYRLVDETRDVWQVFVEQGQYELARRYCRNNRAVMERILTHQAEHCFSQGDYRASARLFAETQRRLEAVALRFVERGEYDALREYVMKRLTSLSTNERLQAGLLVFWTLELFLSQLDLLKDADDPAHKELRRQMILFLMSQEALSHVRPARDAVYTLMSQHGDQAAVVELAALLHDHATVVKHHLKNGQTAEALERLRQHPDPDLFYQWIPKLIQDEPLKTIDLAIVQGRKLKPGQLIPRLIMGDTSQAQGVQILRYLEFCINNLDCQDMVAHNYLVTLYVRYRPEKLMEYLQAEGGDRHCIHYSSAHALRQCWSRLPRAAVHVLTVVGRCEEAVGLALKHDVTLAKQVANMPDDEDPLKKRLWLQIAKHTIQCDQDVQRTMQFLSECPLLRIEDVLPFFPDFVTIDDFKDAICSSLQTYNEHINELRSEMEEATKATEVLRQEINEFRHKYLTVQGTDVCQVCHHQLLTRPLYLFPCGHRFHQDCLTTEILPYLTDAQRETVEHLQRQLETLPSEEAALDAGQSQQGPTAASVSPRQVVRERLDQLVAAECLYCGDYLIRCLDEPLLNDFPGILPER